MANVRKCFKNEAKKIYDFGEMLIQHQNLALSGNDKLDDKKIILLNIAKNHPSVKSAVFIGGYSEKAIRNAIEVLTENGYEIDMELGTIEKI